MTRLRADALLLLVALIWGSAFAFQKDSMSVIGPLGFTAARFLLGTLEGWSRLLGWYDFAIKRDRHVVWNMAWTQKQDVQGVRRTGQSAEDSDTPPRSFAISSTTRLGGESIDDSQPAARV